MFDFIGSIIGFFWGIIAGTIGFFWGLVTGFFGLVWNVVSWIFNLIFSILFFWLPAGNVNATNPPSQYTYTAPAITSPQTITKNNCDSAYPDFCISPSSPDLDCPDIPYRNFTVLSPDPHDLDRDGDGIGCESR